MTFSKHAFGPDVQASLEPEDLKRMVEGIRQVERAMRPLAKNDMARELSAMRCMFGRSVVARKDLKKGTVLTKELLTVKKPGGGIPPAELFSLLGKSLTRDKPMDSLLALDDVCDV
ncbi:MAG: putative N-acylneuraminate-9-phosphate synthase [uncultured bacterium]|nr:MAG: putative N-acylneuraminate-9-phosphate synthase [uncultured bacterium]